MGKANSMLSMETIQIHGNCLSMIEEERRGGGGGMGWGREIGLDACVGIVCLRRILIA